MTDGDLDGDGKETLVSQLVNILVFRIHFLIPLLVVWLFDRLFCYVGQ